MWIVLCRPLFLLLSVLEMVGSLLNTKGGWMARCAWRDGSGGVEDGESHLFALCEGV